MAYNSAHTGTEIDSAVSTVTQNAAAWDSKQDKALLRTVTLPAAGWDASTRKQTVAVDGVVADPDAQAIFIEYSAAGITAVAGDNSLTFSTSMAQSSDVTAKISIMGAKT